MKGRQGNLRKHVEGGCSPSCSKGKFQREQPQLREATADWALALDKCQEQMYSRIALRFSQAGYFMPVIPVLSKLRQEDYKFRASLGYIVMMSYVYILSDVIVLWLYMPGVCTHLILIGTVHTKSCERWEAGLAVVTAILTNREARIRTTHSTAAHTVSLCHQGMLGVSYFQRLWAMWMLDRAEAGPCRGWALWRLGHVNAVLDFFCFLDTGWHRTNSAEDQNRLVRNI